MIIEKSCLKEFPELPGGMLVDQKYVHVSLLNASDGQPLCILSNDDDWELSFSGEDAEYKFMLLLEEKVISYDFLAKHGFKQYSSS